MRTKGQIDYLQGSWFDIDNLRKYDGNGAIYFIGANADLERLYDLLERSDANSLGTPKPRYDVHPLMNMNRSYGLEIRDGKFCIVTAEKLVERILKW